MIRIDSSPAISALITPCPTYRSTPAIFPIKDVFLFEIGKYSLLFSPFFPRGSRIRSRTRSTSICRESRSTGHPRNRRCALIETSSLGNPPRFYSDRAGRNELFVSGMKSDSGNKTHPIDFSFDIPEYK